MKLLKESGCLFPATGGNEGLPTITNYDSRRTVNGLLDTGSTPVYSTIKKGFEMPYFMVFRAFFIAILQYFKPF